jgi:hypothetical protein
MQLDASIMSAAAAAVVTHTLLLCKFEQARNEKKKLCDDFFLSFSDVFTNKLGTGRRKNSIFESVTSH